MQVTDRGRTVAELRPVSESTDEDKVLERLEAEGVLTAPRGVATPGAPVKSKARVSTMILEDRG